jgi:F-type H+-transporting ATPase subunit c
MELEAAKMIGAGLAAIALAGAGVGIGIIFGNYLSVHRREQTGNVGLLCLV